MDAPDELLNAENREIARKLWEVFAASQTQREQLISHDLIEDAPPPVRQAVLRAFDRIWRQGRNPAFAPNPFDF